MDHVDEQSGDAANHSTCRHASAEAHGAHYQPYRAHHSSHAARSYQSGKGGIVGGKLSAVVQTTHSRLEPTAASGVMLNIAIADQYLCILLTGNMFRDTFDREGYERRLLSRTTEDAVTVTSVLVPWNTCGMTQSTVLGVSTFAYLPYCFFNLISPLMSVAVAAIGYKIYRKKDV